MRSKLTSGKLGIACAAAISTLLFIHTYQSYRYVSLEQEVRKLEERQHELLEENKRRTAEIGILSSAERIERIAQEQFDMERTFGEPIRVILPDQRE